MVNKKNKVNITVICRLILFCLSILVIGISLFLEFGFLGRISASFVIIVVISIIMEHLNNFLLKNK